jgi:hypothetical protein
LVDAARRASPLMTNQHAATRHTKGTTATGRAPRVGADHGGIYATLAMLEQVPRANTCWPSASHVSAIGRSGVRAAAPLALAGAEGCAVQRDNAANAQDQSGEDADQREQRGGMEHTIQPLAGNKAESDPDGQ